MRIELQQLGDCFQEQLKKFQQKTTNMCTSHTKQSSVRTLVGASTPLAARDKNDVEKNVEEEVMPIKRRRTMPSVDANRPD